MIDRLLSFVYKSPAQEPPSCAGFFVASLLIDNLNSQIIMGISIITNKTRRCMT